MKNRTHIKINKDAVSSVVSVILVLMIFFSTTSAVLLIGMPQIDRMKAMSQCEATGSYFAIIDDTLDNLAEDGVAAQDIGEVNIESGSLYIDTVADRQITIFSYDENYDINFSLDPDDPNKCTIDMESGNVDNATIYWLDNNTCFLAGTQVVMADGSYKNIEEIEIGDRVRSYDEETKKIIECKVESVFHHLPDEMAEYYLVIDDYLKVTPNHRFYSENRWVYANDLEIGDSLFCIDSNQECYISSINKVFNKMPTFNMEVEGCHNYFVSLDGVDVLVHNPVFPGYNEDQWITPAGWKGSDTLWQNPSYARDGSMSSAAKFTTGPFGQDEDARTTDWLIVYTTSESPWPTITCDGFGLSAVSDSAHEWLKVQLSQGGTVRDTEVLDYDDYDTDYPEDNYFYCGGRYLVNQMSIKMRIKDAGFPKYDWLDHQGQIKELRFHLCKPTCTITGLSDVTEESVTLSGRIIDSAYYPDGGCIAGFGYIKGGIALQQVAAKSGVKDGEAYSKTINGLDSGDGYIFAAYGLNPAGLEYSDTALACMTIPAAPEVTSTTKGTTSIHLYWDEPYNYPGVDVYTKIVARTDRDPTNHNDGTEWVTTEDEDFPKSGLSPGTTYHIGLWTYAEEYLGSPYSDTVSAWSTDYYVVRVTTSSAPTNHPPDKPSTPTGDTPVDVGASHDYTTSATDPDGDKVEYGWDWDGNGVVDEWDDNGGSYYTQGVPIARSNSWSSIGTYNVKVRARDDEGLSGEWSDPLAVDVIAGTGPPDQPSIGTGFGDYLNCYNDTVYSDFGVHTTGSSDLKYRFSWGDGTQDTQWIGPYAPGNFPPGAVDHVWTSAGVYEVGVQVKSAGVDGSWNTPDDLLSDWSDPLGINVDYTHILPINTHASESLVFNGGNSWSASENLDDSSICIMLFNDSYPSATDPAKGKVPFGIIRVDILGSITHSISSSTGEYKTIIENGAIIAVSPTGNYISSCTNFDETNDDTLRLNVVKLGNIDGASGASGSGICQIDFETRINDVVEKQHEVCMIKVNIEGPNEEAWDDILTTEYKFKRQSSSGDYSDTLIYDEGKTKQLIFTTALVNAGIRSIK